MYDKELINDIEYSKYINFLLTTIAFSSHKYHSQINKCLDNLLKALRLLASVYTYLTRRIATTYKYYVCLKFEQNKVLQILLYNCRNVFTKARFARMI